METISRPKPTGIDPHGLVDAAELYAREAPEVGEQRLLDLRRELLANGHNRDLVDAVHEGLGRIRRMEGDQHEQ